MKRKVGSDSEALRSGKPLLTAREFAEILGVSRNTFSRLKKAGQIPMPVSGLGARIARWSTQRVLEFIQGGAA